MTNDIDVNTTAGYIAIYGTCLTGATSASLVGAQPPHCIGIFCSSATFPLSVTYASYDQVNLSYGEPVMDFPWGPQTLTVHTVNGDTSQCVFGLTPCTPPQLIPVMHVSGTVTQSGQGLSGVIVNVADANNTVVAFSVTGSDGTYSITVQMPTTPNTSWTVTPSMLGYFFSPTSLTVFTWGSSSANFTAYPLTTVYLIHGIGQTSSDMSDLASDLTAPGALDLTRFRVDAGFSFGECAANTSCTTTCANNQFCSSTTPKLQIPCSISAGAQSLVNYISNRNRPGPILLVGYSMGGLISRDMISNNFYGAPIPTVAGLITLDTPHLGYPYNPTDELVQCGILVEQMCGGWTPQNALAGCPGQPANQTGEILSTYLTGLVGSPFFRSTLTSNGAYWMATAGQYCGSYMRTLSTPIGCLASSPRSDCVVCKDSELYNISSLWNDITPIAPWTDTLQIYVHSNNYAGFGTALLFGPANPIGLLPGPISLEIYNPPPSGSLFPALVNQINATGQNQ